MPASHIVSTSAGVNEDFLTGLQGHFGGTPDMQMTDTGIDTTLLSFLRSTLSTPEDLERAGWPGLAAVQQSRNFDIPMDVMAQFTLATDINMEATVRPCLCVQLKVARRQGLMCGVASCQRSSGGPAASVGLWFVCLKPGTSVQVLETILAWVDRQLRAYPSSVQSDLEEVALPSTSWLRVQTLRALISEKNALLGIQRKVKEHKQDLREGCPLETLYD